MTDAQKTFAIQSDAYAVARPLYPAALYDWILQHTPDRRNCWDCATGNGQAARDLAPYFEHILATDISAEQLAQAWRAPNITYQASPAEVCDAPDAAFDLVTVAQALHWFDFNAFWPEVMRVARPGAFFCAWGYAWFSSSPAVDENLVQPVRNLIQPYWAAQNRRLWNGYLPPEIDFPFEPLQAPPLSIDLAWRPKDVLAYMQTWSAYKRAAAVPEVQRALIDAIEAGLTRCPDAPVEISMPLTVLAGRIPAN